MKLPDRHRVPLCLALLVAATIAWPHRAAAENAGYQLNFSANAMVLDHPGDQMIMMLAGWQLQSVLMMERSMPLFDLMNTSDTALLTSFEMTIGDTDYSFSNIDIISPEGVGIVANVIDGGDKVSFSFTNFTPGTTIRFQLPLEADDPMMFQTPDFREVLFMANSGGPVAANSMLTTGFAEAGFDPLSLTGFLPNYPVNPLFVGPTVRSYFEMDKVQLFQFGDVGQLVPEPGSLAIMLTGIVSLFCIRRRRRV